MNEIRILADFINRVDKQALAVYTPTVEDICSRKNVSRKELEELLDWLVSVCVSNDMIELFKRACRKFYYQYPESIMDYVLIYKELYEGDIE